MCFAVPAIFGALDCIHFDHQLSRNGRNGNNWERTN
jgi:hypothetical protein